MFNYSDPFQTLYFSLRNNFTFNPQVLAGKPIIRGLRISVAMILELLVKGASTEEILEDYPELELEDIQAALFYAYQLVDKEEVTARVAIAKAKAATII